MKVDFMDLKGCFDDIYDEVILKIAELIKTTQFIGGEEVKLFEEEYAKFCKTDYCVGCANGTDAIIIALKAMGIKAGETVLVPVNTFIATSEAVTAVGAKVAFIDVEEDYYTISPEKIKEYLELHPKENVSAIIAVHLYGQMANMPKIKEIADKYKLKIIEDSAQSHGSTLNGHGPGHYGDVATFSFYPGKNLGAFGDAGAIVTNNKDLFETMRMLVNHGRWNEKYTHSIEGYNMRLDSIQAAVLRIKLRHLEKWNNIRKEKARKYIELLKGKDIILPKERNGSNPVYHLFVIKTKDREKTQRIFKSNNISCGIHYPIPLHLQPAYQYLGYKEGEFPVSERDSKEILSLPLWPEISFEQIEYVCKTLTEIK